MEGSSSNAVKESWTRSIKIKTLQEELGKVQSESWAALQVERYELSFALRRRQEQLAAEIAELEALEAKAKDEARRLKAAKLASRGILALPSRSDQLQELQEELEQARVGGDIQKAVDVRRSMLALQDSTVDSGSGAVSSSPPLAITDAEPVQATDPDFDPRQRAGVEIEVPLRRNRTAPRGRAAERYVAMQEELRQAGESGDTEKVAELKRRLDTFRMQFSDETQAAPQLQQPQRPPREDAAKGGRKGRGRGRAGQAAAAATAKARAKPPTDQGSKRQGEGLKQQPGDSKQQARAKEQLDSWRQEMQLLELGMLDYQGDEECAEAIKLHASRRELEAKIAELERAAAVGGSTLDAALRSLNPDVLETQLAALAKLNVGR